MTEMETDTKTDTEAGTGRPEASRIVDTRWRAYDGPRLGSRSAVLSVARHSAQRVLGLKRPARTKVLPFLTIGIAYLPAAVFVGLIALLPRQLTDALPTYGQYYGFVTAAMVLFVALAAPEALCPDRRWRFVSLYLASPLTRTSYLAAKAIGVGTVVLLSTTGPLLLLLVGLVLQGSGPDGVTGFLSVLGRILAAGIALSAFYTALSLAISSLTDRRAFAAAGVLLAVFGSHAVGGILAFGLGLGDRFFLMSLLALPFDLASRIHGENPFADEQVDPVSIGTGESVAAFIAVTLLAMAIAWWRVNRLQVTR